MSAALHLGRYRIEFVVAAVAANKTYANADRERRQAIWLSNVIFMTTASFEPLTVTVPLREEPAGVFRVGNTRVPLELVLDAYQPGESPEAIARSYRSLRLTDVYAIITRYLADPAPFDEYLRQCDEQAAVVRKKLEATGMTGRVTKEDLLERAQAKGLIS